MTQQSARLRLLIQSGSTMIEHALSSITSHWRIAGTMKFELGMFSIKQTSRRLRFTFILYVSQHSGQHSSSNYLCALRHYLPATLIIGCHEGTIAEKFLVYLECRFQAKQPHIQWFACRNLLSSCYYIICTLTGPIRTIKYS